MTKRLSKYRIQNSKPSTIHSTSTVQYFHITNSLFSYVFSSSHSFSISRYHLKTFNWSILEITDKPWNIILFPEAFAYFICGQKLFQRFLYPQIQKSNPQSSTARIQWELCRRTARSVPLSSGTNPYKALLVIFKAIAGWSLFSICN